MLPRIAFAAAVAAALLTAPASAQIPLPIPTVVPTVVPGLPSQGPGAQPYQANDGKGFRDILPPGTRGRYNAAELAAFLAAKQTVPHCCDQLGMYRDLMYATPGLCSSVPSVVYVLIWNSPPRAFPSRSYLRPKMPV